MQFRAEAQIAAERMRLLRENILAEIALAPVPDAVARPGVATASATAASSPQDAVATPAVRTYTNAFGAFRWTIDLEKNAGDVSVGDPCATSSYPRGRSWMPGGNHVQHVLAVKYQGGDKVIAFLCKLRGYQLDRERHWFRGVATGASNDRSWMTDPAGPSAAAPAALAAFFESYPATLTNLRNMLTSKQAKGKARAAVATGAPATAPTDCTAVDRRQARPPPRAAAASARAALRSLAVDEAARKHPLFAASIRAQAATATRREAVHPLVAIRRACRPPPIVATQSPAQAAAATRREAVHPLVAIRRACRPPPTVATQSPAPMTMPRGGLEALSDDTW
jgi:hypothetical protein